MAFVDIAYVVTAPLLLLLIGWGGASWKPYLCRLLAACNFLLILHALFLIRQVAGLVELARKATVQLGLHASDWPLHFDGFTLRLVLAILLPSLFLYKRWRSDIGLSILMVVLLYWNNPCAHWHAYDLFFNILTWLCLLCTAYALLWLREKPE